MSHRTRQRLGWSALITKNKQRRSQSLTHSSLHHVDWRLMLWGLWMEVRVSWIFLCITQHLCCICASIWMQRRRVTDHIRLPSLCSSPTIAALSVELKRKLKTWGFHAHTNSQCCNKLEKHARLETLFGVFEAYISFICCKLFWKSEKSLTERNIHYWLSPAVNLTAHLGPKCWF